MDGKGRRALRRGAALLRIAPNHSLQLLPYRRGAGKRPKVKRMPIRPGSPDALSGTARWLLDRSLQAGHNVVARWAEHLFGSAACPSCGSTVRVEEAIRSAAA